MNCRVLDTTSARYGARQLTGTELERLNAEGRAGLFFMKRDEGLDTAKGIGLLAVIAAHVGVVEPLRVFFYIFHLPIFFIISGYFYLMEEWSIFFKKKVKGYLIPYISCATVIVLFRFLYALYAEGLDAAVMTARWDAVALLLQERYTTLWFLAALFLGILIFDAIIRVTKGGRALYFVCTGVSAAFILYDTFVAVPLPWNLDTAFIIQFYLAFGHFAREKDLFRRLAFERKHPWVTAGAFALGSVGLTAVNQKITGETYEMFYSSYGIFPLTLAAAVLMSLAVIILAYRVRMRFAAFLGRNSMIYFAFHQSIGIPIALGVVGRIPFGETIQGRLMHFLIIYGLVIGICGVTDFVIRHTPMKFMAGK